MSVLSDKHFHNEAAAYKLVEARIWPDGPVYPHCGGFERISKMAGKSTRIGTCKCYQCRKPFTVKIGTIVESTHRLRNEDFVSPDLLGSAYEYVANGYPVFP